MPRRVDKETGVKRGKPQTGKYKKVMERRRELGKANGVKKGTVVGGATPTWDEERQLWVNGHGDPICGAPRTGRSMTGPGICCQPAGWGTDHLGSGQCKNHGGSLPTVAAKAHVNLTLNGMTPTFALWGTPIEITPELAMLQEVHRTQGAVIWLSEQLAVLPEQDHHKPYGHWLIDKYQEERQHLVAVCKAAITMGIQQRQVELAQEQGKLLAAVLQAFTLDPDLGLTPAQRQKVPDLLRKHLTTIPKTVLASPPQLPKADDDSD